MSEVIMVCGCQASGKSSLSKEFIKQDYVYINRDSQGGKIVDLVPLLDQTLKTGSKAVIDNTLPTIAERKLFIDVCKKHNVPISCLHMGTSIEDSQINALHRMYERHKRFFFSPDDFKGVKDPNMFPIAALFNYRKRFEKPTVAEGFARVETIKFERMPIPGYNNKALILDYDGNLRNSTGLQDYPYHPDEIEILPGRAEKISEYVKAGYILLGVSNQSGIHKGTVKYDAVVACFEKTNELLGHEIDYHFCPHQSNPPTCYCRKPQSGNAVLLIHKYKLEPSQCIFVGDQTSDKTFAQRAGFQFFWTDEFFTGV